MIILKSSREIGLMRDAGKIVAETLVEIQKNVEPGISTLELDRIAEKYIRSAGAVPSFKGYAGFPASICASVNEEVVHGIPCRQKILKDGDIVSIDIGAVINGFHGDAAKTFPVGKVEAETMRLLEITEQALHRAIAKAEAGRRLGDVSHAVQSYAEKYGCGVVRDYVGHGIGKRMHEEPQIPNYGSAGRGPRLKSGMALAIEPMLNLGTHEVIKLKDNWTVITKDRKPSAHFEHTIAIIDGKPEIMTKC
jgi:methionyl aminopeptidase